MPVHLLSRTEGPSILIDRPILLIGRHDECDVQLHSKKVSRRHCVLAQVNDYLIVRDLGSTNGVRVNGQRVLEGKLYPGDELQVGNFRYQVCADPIGRPSEPSPAGSSKAGSPGALGSSESPAASEPPQPPQSSPAGSPEPVAPGPADEDSEPD